MIEIDGSQGEGGGQIFRTSLTLSMCLGKSVRIANIRAGRAKPGLLRQHLTCLHAAQAICSASVTGGELGSTDVTFKPGAVRAGVYRFAVGTAGSTSLVFQTIWLPLCFAEGVSEIVLEGGTHNGFAPSFDYIDTCFRPVIEGMGYRVEAALERFGFYPAGGGLWRVQIHPVDEIKALKLMERGEVRRCLAVATSSRIPEHITERELAQAKKQCSWPELLVRQRLVESSGPGNIFSLRIESENITEVIEVVGERRLSAERVADRAISAVIRYLTADVPVGEYLADQLLLTMVLGGGGKFRTLRPSQHLLSNTEVIRQFMAVEITIQQKGELDWLVDVGTMK